MSSRIAFTVVGEPAPQGSKRHVGNGVMVESSKKVAPWRQDVVAAAMLAKPAGWQPIDEPVALFVTFFLKRPVSAPKSRVSPDRKPDLDKLLRSTLDALTTAQIVADDARICTVSMRKEYAVNGQELGARIRVEAMG